MCGRFTITLPIDELILRYIIEDSKIINYKPRYNVAPMQNIPAIISSKMGNRLGELRWGLVPSWAKDQSMGSKMINARAESLADKPSFRQLLASRRCIIPADGFYEWKQEGERKQPYRIMMQDGSVFSFAGLYDIWSDPNGNKLSTCTIITTAANPLMASIHHRMPAILSPEDEAKWLDRNNTDVQFMKNLLKPYDAKQMKAYPVSSAVGNVRNDSRELIEKII